MAANSCPAVTCGWDGAGGEPSEIYGNGDIAGIGVTLSFIITAWIVVFLLLGYYIFIFDPELDPFRRNGSTAKVKYPNPIDRVFLGNLRKIPAALSLDRFQKFQIQELGPALDKCVITFSDIQFFTGTAILICAFRELSCGIQVYHWEMIVQLGWFASMTHLSALSFLRNYLVNHLGQRLWRLGAMFVMLVFLSVAIGITAHFFPTESGSPKQYAVCFVRLGLRIHGDNIEGMVVTLLVLLYGYTVRITKMSKSFEGRLRSVASGWKRRSMKKESEWDPRSCTTVAECIRVRVLDPIYIAFFRVIHVQLDLFVSFSAEVLWLTLSTTWGMRRLFRLRTIAPQDEKNWSFGQILSLILLAAPIPAIWDHFSSTVKKVPMSTATSWESTTTLASDSPMEEEEKSNQDKEYERSISFIGLLGLVALPYFELGLFFNTFNASHLAGTIALLSLSLFVVNPVLQMVWVICVLWVGKMKWPRWMVHYAQTIVFITLLWLNVADFRIPSAYRFQETDVNGFHSSKVVLTSKGTIDSARLIIVLMFTYPFAVVGVSLHRRLARVDKWYGAVLHNTAILAVGIVSLVVSFCLSVFPDLVLFYGDPYWWQLDHPSFLTQYDFWVLCFLPVLIFLVVWMGVEWTMDKLGLKIGYSRAVRGFVILACLCLTITSLFYIELVTWIPAKFWLLCLHLAILMIVTTGWWIGFVRRRWKQPSRNRK